MKSLFNNQDLEEVLTRIDRITPGAQRQWGKMELAQMLAHAANALEMAMGKINPPRVFIGRLLGRFFKSRYTEDTPFSKGNPTSESIRVIDTREFAAEKERLRKAVEQFAAGGEKGCTSHPHPFFGILTPSEWGIGMYKHLDHHLRQFGS